MICRSADRWWIVRTLWIRSASLTRITRMSLPMARIIFRRDSAFWSATSEMTTRLILVTPSTSWATFSPNSSRISSMVATVSSTVSWSKPVETVSSSMFQSARMKETFRG